MKKVIIIHNHGLGNVLMLAPMLRAMEASNAHLQYLVMDHPLWHDELILRHAGLKNLTGFLPADWRRFDTHSQKYLLNYARRNEVDGIINLRLEDPLQDGNYFAFHEQAARMQLPCFDLHQDGRSVSMRPIYEMLGRRLFDAGLLRERVDWFWLNDAMIPAADRIKDPSISLWLGASRPSKRWALDLWVDFVNQVMERFPHRIRLYSGLSFEEHAFARALMDRIPYPMQERLLLQQPSSVLTLLGTLKTTDWLVTHDTFVAHLAAAARIPTTALYITTNSAVWAPYHGEEFRVLQSPLSLHCDSMKRDGTCRLYYGSCKQTCRSGLTPQDLLAHIPASVAQPEEVCV